MAPDAIDLIESGDPATRDWPIDRWCQGRSADELLSACADSAAFVESLCRW